MGGYGSGRSSNRQRREIVEQCYYVSAADLPSIPMPSQEIPIPVRRHGGQKLAILHCRTELLEGGTPALSFQLPLGDNTLSQAIPLGNTQARSGGERVCFLCPIAVGEGYCGRPCRKLYAPPGAKYLGCRQCHGLSYKSAQKRTKRILRAETEADKLIENRNKLFAGDKRGETLNFDEMLRIRRRLSYAISDLWESLHLSVCRD